jgi:hypothetical protein
MTRSSTIVKLPQPITTTSRGTPITMTPGHTPTRAVYEPVFLQEETLETRAMQRLSPRLKELVRMLEYCRPEDSDTEQHFISTYLDTLPGMTKDAYGNRICKVGKANPTVAWSSHTDTVHCDEGLQAVELDKHGNLGLDWNSDANCLGADCGVGVWLMRRMIMAGKPGLYIFHRKEESGGQGSRWIAKNTPELVADIQIMIALDRRGFDSVITEQSTGVTASKAFALSMAEQLGGKFAPDDGGIFTDSAFYNHLIPECTNLSVGYNSQHGRSETQDMQFADQLLLSLLKLDYGRLIVARDPKAISSPRKTYGFHSYTHGAWMDGVEDAEQRHVDEQWIPANYNLVELIGRYPEAAARLMQQWDLDEDDLYEAIRERETQ